eukprot:1175932-Prorocentrum_minimum.AAC.1
MCIRDSARTSAPAAATSGATPARAIHRNTCGVCISSCAIVSVCDRKRPPRQEGGMPLMRPPSTCEVFKATGDESKGGRGDLADLEGGRGDLADLEGLIGRRLCTSARGHHRGEADWAGLQVLRQHGTQPANGLAPLAGAG